jgi:DNA-binding transcriptional LysR family regulator
MTPSDGGSKRAGPRPGRALQLDDLRTFCAAVELGSLGKTAQRLRMSQPSISKRLKSLETLAGVPLLERSAHGVTPTAAGERLYTRARRISAEIEELDGLLQDLAGSRETVQLAISHTAAEYVMPKALVLMHHHTSAPVEVLTANSRVVKRMVLAGETDLGVVACMSDEAVEGVVNIPLLYDEIVVAVPLAHPWARKRMVSLAELQQTPFVRRDPAAHTRQVVDGTLERLGLEPLAAACEVGSTQAAKEEAHELCLPTAMSRLAFSTADNLEIVQVEGLRFERRFCMLHPHGTPSTACSHLMAAFKVSAQRLESSAVQPAGGSQSAGSAEGTSAPTR